MKVFLDANVLISVLNKEYPLFTFSSRILSLSDSKKHQLYTSPLALAIAFYFSSKKSGETMAKKKMALLIDHVHTTTLNQEITKKAISDKRAHDFEDGMQYYSAMEASCDIIVTEDQGDFHFGKIAITDCEGFVRDFA